MSEEFTQTEARVVPGRAGLAGTIGAAVFAMASVVGFLAESTARTDGFDDGDNPAESLALLQVNPNAYSLSGLALSCAALGLLMLVLAVSESVLRTARPLYARFITALGLFSAGLLFLAGVIRLQAPGTVTHIASLDRDWGLAAYLAVQMSGTQGALSAAIFAFALWATVLCVVAARAHALPVAVWLVGLLPTMALALPVVALLGRLAGLPPFDALYPLYLIAVLGGIPLFALALGAALLRKQALSVA